MTVKCVNPNKYLTIQEVASHFIIKYHPFAYNIIVSPLGIIVHFLQFLQYFHKVIILFISTLSSLLLLCILHSPELRKNMQHRKR